MKKDFNDRYEYKQAQRRRSQFYSLHNDKVFRRIEELRAQKRELEIKKQKALDIALWDENKGMRAIFDKRVSEYSKIIISIGIEIESLREKYIIDDTEIPQTITVKDIISIQIG